MSEELKDYLLDDYKDTNDYCPKVWRSGLYNLPPAIVGCAITGGNNGKESNPNLPETIEEQVESTYEAYKAGAVMVHIHCRDKNNLAVMTHDPEYYKEVNAKIREKCPDIIINNTNIMGRPIDSDSGTLGAPMNTITEASAELGSIDVSNYVSQIKMAPRNPGEQPWVLNRGYTLSFADCQAGIEKMEKFGVKPEFECFAMSDLHYVNWLVNNGVIHPTRENPNWINFVYTTGSNWNDPMFMCMLKKACPKNSILGIIGAGAQQWSVLTQALIHGLHVRVGMEDNVYLEKGRKADSNAQLVEKIRTIAGLLGRRTATCEEARTMLGLGAPRTW
jgi:3-keto-5-aminohexanoate cleavage enzyme